VGRDKHLMVFNMADYTSTLSVTITLSASMVILKNILRMKPRMMGLVTSKKPKSIKCIQNKKPSFIGLRVDKKPNTTSLIKNRQPKIYK